MFKLYAYYQMDLHALIKVREIESERVIFSGFRFQLEMLMNGHKLETEEISDADMDLIKEHDRLVCSDEGAAWSVGGRTPSRKFIEVVVYYYGRDQQKEMVVRSGNPELLAEIDTLCEMKRVEDSELELAKRIEELEGALSNIKSQAESLQDANNGIEYSTGLDELFSLINKPTYTGVGFMNYEEMSDFEINKAIATHESLIVNDCQSASLKVKGSSVLVNDIVSQFEFNPCKNWSDIGPLIEECDISLININESGEWFACSNVEFETICMSPDGNDSGASCFSAKNESYCKNPKRAAAICYLKMMGSEK